MLREVIGKLISRVIHDPHPKRAGSSVLDILYARIHYEKQQPNFHGDQTRCEKIFYTVVHVPYPGQNFW